MSDYGQYYQIDEEDVLEQFSGIYPNSGFYPADVESAYSRVFQIIHRAADKGEKVFGEGWMNTFTANSALGSHCFRAPREDEKNVYLAAMEIVNNEKEKVKETKRSVKKSAK